MTATDPVRGGFWNGLGSRAVPSSCQKRPAKVMRGSVQQTSTPARGVSATVQLGSLATGEPVVLDHATLRIGTTDATAVQPILDALRARGAVIRTLRPVRPSLEDLFMEAVTDPNTGQVLSPGASRPGAKP